MSQSQSIDDLIVIGGGIAGLSAAYYLKKRALEGSARISLLESTEKIGGKIATDVVTTDLGDFLLEKGPDSFLVQKPWALELARELNLEAEMLETNDHHRHIFVLKNGKLIKMPDGMQLMVPTKFWPFVKTPLLSPLGKLRAAMELFVQKKGTDEDESIADFIKRRLGSEILTYIAEPLLSGIYNSDAKMQSLNATFPQFAAIEKKHGSLIRGMLAKKKFGQKPMLPSPKSAFISFKLGMRTLTSALQEHLADVIQFGARAESIRLAKNGTYEIVLSNHTTRFARALLISTPASHSASLLENLSPEAAMRLKALRTKSSGSIYLAFRRADVAHRLEGFGVVIPESEKRSINAITWTSSKLALRAPADAVLLRVFFGGSKTSQAMAYDDNQIEQLARQELLEIMNIKAVPLFSRIYRSYDANPQYDLGHLKTIAQIEQALPDGVFLAGSSYLGVGIPDCVHQGKMAAEKIWHKINLPKSLYGENRQ